MMLRTIVLAGCMIAGTALVSGCATSEWAAGPAKRTHSEEAEHRRTGCNGAQNSDDYLKCRREGPESVSAGVSITFPSEKDSKDKTYFGG